MEFLSTGLSRTTSRRMRIVKLPRPSAFRKLSSSDRKTKTRRPQNGTSMTTWASKFSGTRTRRNVPSNSPWRKAVGRLRLLESKLSQLKTIKPLKDRLRMRKLLLLSRVSHQSEAVSR